VAFALVFVYQLLWIRVLYSVWTADISCTILHHSGISWLDRGRLSGAGRPLAVQWFSPRGCV